MYENLGNVKYPKAVSFAYQHCTIMSPLHAMLGGLLKCIILHSERLNCCFHPLDTSFSLLHVLLKTINFYWERLLHSKWMQGGKWQFFKCLQHWNNSNAKRKSWQSYFLFVLERTFVANMQQKWEILAMYIVYVEGAFY